jgi:hypothetical protein
MITLRMRARMVKTAVDLEGDDEEPVTGMTAEDIARYLLDALVVDKPKSQAEMHVRLKLANSYIELAKAYIIADAIRDANITITKRSS